MPIALPESKYWHIRDGGLKMPHPVTNSCLSVDPGDTVVLWIPNFSARRKGAEDCTWGAGLQEQGQAACAHGEGAWRGPSLSTLSMWRLAWWTWTGGQAARAQEAWRNTIRAGSGPDEPGCCRFTVSTEKLGQAPSASFHHLRDHGLCSHGCAQWAQVRRGRGGEATGYLEPVCPPFQGPTCAASCYTSCTVTAPSACSGMWESVVMDTVLNLI